MIFIILAGSSRISLFLNFFFFLALSLSLSHPQRKASFLSLFLFVFFLVDRIVYQHVLYSASYGRGVSFAHLSRVSFRRIASSAVLFFLRFASASLYNSYSHSYCYSSQARRASSVAYLYYQS